MQGRQAMGGLCSGRALASSSWGVGPLSARSASGRHSTAVLKFSMPIAFAMPLPTHIEVTWAQGS